MPCFAFALHPGKKSMLVVLIRLTSSSSMEGGTKFESAAASRPDWNCSAGEDAVTSRLFSSSSTTMCGKTAVPAVFRCSRNFATQSSCFLDSMAPGRHSRTKSITSRLFGSTFLFSAFRNNQKQAASVPARPFPPRQWIKTLPAASSPNAPKFAAILAHSFLTFSKSGKGAISTTCSSSTNLMPTSSHAFRYSTNFTPSEPSSDWFKRQTTMFTLQASFKCVKSSRRLL
mmetsp:Transcript_8044/g.19402  ORF Transcript_8044/g.19402 Transcript_8044/m.19402 type:complete len:229 (-) Transcript_8044:563-1249(-)